jgi:hypothetical protein
VADNADRLVDLARREFDAGDRDQERADAHYWKAAEAMWRANKQEGLSQREIATGVGRSAPTVGRCIRVWEACIELDTKPSWAEAFARLVPDVGGEAVNERKANAALRDPVRIARQIVDDPKARQAVQEALEHEGVARAVIENAPLQTAVTVHRAITDRYQKQATRYRKAEKARETEDDISVKLGDIVLSIVQTAGGQRRLLERIRQHEREYGRIDEDTREGILAWIRRGIAELEMLEAYLNGELEGDAFDQGLSELLKGE